VDKVHAPYPPPSPGPKGGLFACKQQENRLKSLLSLFERKPDDADAYYPGICPQIHKEGTMNAQDKSAAT
jgi:hypothetical protein